MDSQKFIELLPQVYDHFEQELKPVKNDNFISIPQPLNSVINPNILRLLNTVVTCLEEKEIYCETTNNLGVTLIASLMDNPEIMAYGIIDDDNLNLEQLNQNLDLYNCADRVYLYEGDINNFTQDLQALESNDKIGTFYINGEKSYRKILQNLMLIRPFLAEEAFIIISQTEIEEVKEAIEDFKTFNDSDKIHQLLTVNQESQLYSILEQELVILLWRNNIFKKQIQNINQRGLIKLNQTNQEYKKNLLHVGCGGYNPDALPQQFRSQEWVEIRLDIDPNVQPDIIGTITNLTAVPDNSVDAVYSSHNLEHIYNYEVPIALAEFKRVLKPNGFVMITLPDIQEVANHIVNGNLENPLYISPAGPICAIDILYGLEKSLAIGNYYMAHKTAFTDKTLGEKMVQIGFVNVKVTKGKNFDLWAIGYK